MHVKHKWISFGLSIFFVFINLGSGEKQTGLAADEAPAPIRLQAGSFFPTLDQEPPLPPNLTIESYIQDQLGYYIVQFQGPIEQPWKDQVTQIGGEILEYIPDFAFKVRMTQAQALQVESLDNVTWVGIFQPAFKLSPQLKLEGMNLYKVRFEPGSDISELIQSLSLIAVDIIQQDGNMAVVAAEASLLESIAKLLDVAWIENFVPFEKHNEYGAGVIIGANIANSNGYYGASQIVAVADSGLGDGTVSGAHTDIPSSRITAIQNFPGSSSAGCYTIYDDGAVDVDTGHGTHVALSILGDGGTSGEGKGTAPAASLVFQAIENYTDFTGFCSLQYSDGYYLLGIPTDFQTLFQQAYNAGARIHSNSWGSALNGQYTSDSANVDNFIWNNPDMTITFSAGNEGTDSNNNGVVDSDSTNSPATAKNIITVGASENDRQNNYQCDTGLTYTSHDAYQTGQTCSSMSGQNILGTAGERWDFNAEPLKSDISAGNQEQMASFSSRGPTDDGRIKPDVVAPGTWVLSGYSNLYQEGFGNSTNPQNGSYQFDGWGMPISSTYKYMGGTSMSNPLTAGAAAVVRDFYSQAHSHSASAALVKATLINSAVDLLDENNDGANVNDFPIPNDHEGWGRVNVNNATDGSHQFIDQTTGLGTSGTDEYSFPVLNSGKPFKVSLVWSDYPSTETASFNLVNDLDLEVISPQGIVYLGNNFSGGWSQSGGSVDRVNNVENVYIQTVQTGTWTVRVKGYNIPQGSQPYALVVDGSFVTSSISLPIIVNGL